MKVIYKPVKKPKHDCVDHFPEGVVYPPGTLVQCECGNIWRASFNTTWELPKVRSSGLTQSVQRSTYYKLTWIEYLWERMRGHIKYDDLGNIRPRKEIREVRNEQRTGNDTAE